jgi:chloramphenicol O-acetyltransferase type A
MNITDINIDNWSRRGAYNLYRRADFPFFSLTTEIDVTTFMQNANKHGIPHFNFTVYNIMRAVNEIEELRTRFEGQSVQKIDVTNPSFTVPTGNKDFAFCDVDYNADWEVFNGRCHANIEAAKKQTQLVETSSTKFVTYLSCMPWVHFTSATHPVMNTDDCIPRIVWGKYDKRGDKTVMALNLQAHHALVDGHHAAEFFLLSEKYMSELPKMTSI